MWPGASPCAASRRRRPQAAMAAVCVGQRAPAAGASRHDRGPLGRRGPRAAAPEEVHALDAGLRVAGDSQGVLLPEVLDVGLQPLRGTLQRPGRGVVHEDARQEGRSPQADAQPDAATARADLLDLPHAGGLLKNGRADIGVQIEADCACNRVHLVDSVDAQLQLRNLVLAPGVHEPLRAPVHRNDLGVPHRADHLVVVPEV
mmetsp:Transcript_95100/g.266282  ORF Transcript_95100/g.266282 Transcript_95100/m.266282 type:complete len:202 (-) Transcript_95100:691-1296(-)